jgi:hypothetical protein
MIKKIVPIVVTLLVLSISLVGALPAAGAEPAEIDNAIDSGVAWLVDQQNEDGSWGEIYVWDSQEYQQYPVAKTGLAVLKLEEHAVDSQYGYGLSSPLDPTYVYHENVVAGLDYLMDNAYDETIGLQVHDGSNDNPDTNGNGIGVYFVSPDSGWCTVYETSIAIMALSASRAHGLYGDVVQDAVDWLAWAQTDSGWGRGGWSYEEMDNAGDWSDNSNSGWVTLALAYAESPAYGFECTVPEFVRSELDIWIDYIQNDVDGDEYDGGSAYSYLLDGVDDDGDGLVDEDPWDGVDNDGDGLFDEDPGAEADWVNILKTGTLLQQMAFYGDTADTTRVQDAIDYIVRHWDNPNPEPGWRGDPASYQATFTVMKGLESFGIDEIDDIDWFEEISDVLVAQQDDDGFWPSCYWDDGEQILSTEWALLTLQKVVPPITATVRIEPETLELTSEGVLTAFITLPEGLDVTDIDTGTVECEGAPAIKGVVAHHTLIAKFDVQDLVGVATGDEVTLTVTGKLATGTPFAGSDTIRVIEMGKK